MHTEGTVPARTFLLESEDTRGVLRHLLWSIVDTLPGHVDEWGQFVHDRADEMDEGAGDAALDRLDSFVIHLQAGLAQLRDLHAATVGDEITLAISETLIDGHRAYLEYELRLPDLNRSADIDELRAHLDTLDRLCREEA